MKQPFLIMVIFTYPRDSTVNPLSYIGCKLTHLCFSYADILPNLLASCVAYLLMIVAIVMCTGEVCGALAVHCDFHVRFLCHCFHIYM